MLSVAWSNQHTHDDIDTWTALNIRDALELVFLGISTWLEHLGILHVREHLALFDALQVALDDSWIANNLELLFALDLRSQWLTSDLDQQVKIDPQFV